jgi:hypothetical protein
MAQPEGQRSPTLIFLHIPKTAGTTLETILDREYSHDATFVVGVPRGTTEEAFSQWPLERRQKTRLVYGPMGFGVHEHCGRPATYTTLLRHPVTRVVSTYHYIRRRPNHTHYQRLTAGSMGLMDFVREGVFKIGVDNGQTRLLSGAPKSGDQIGFRGCTRDHLELAKTNLTHHFSAVGLMERYDASLLLMQRAYGWKTPYCVSQNVRQGRSQREELSQADRDTIAEYNQLDLELYAHAQALFQQQFQRQGPLFSLRAKIFTWLNQQRNSRLGKVPAAV